MTIDAMIRDLNSNLQASSCDDSIEGVHEDSRSMRSLRPQVNLCLKIKYCEKEKFKFDITIHYPSICVGTIYFHEVIAKISQQNELTSF